MGCVCVTYVCVMYGCMCVCVTHQPTGRLTDYIYERYELIKAHRQAIAHLGVGMCVSRWWACVGGYVCVAGSVCELVCVCVSR